MHTRRAPEHGRLRHARRPFESRYERAGTVRYESPRMQDMSGQHLVLHRGEKAARNPLRRQRTRHKPVDACGEDLGWPVGSPPGGIVGAVSGQPLLFRTLSIEIVGQLVDQCASAARDGQMDGACPGIVHSKGRVRGRIHSKADAYAREAQVRQYATRVSDAVSERLEKIRSPVDRYVGVECDRSQTDVGRHPCRRQRRVALEPYRLLRRGSH
jgi:hypothetical protein